MSLDSWRLLVDSLSYGKRLPGAVYFARPGKWARSNLLHAEIRRAALAARPPLNWNLVKLHTREYAITFLSYPAFDEEAHPALAHATKINLTTGRIVRTDYAKRPNPPILHRKETFLPPDDPRIESWRELTLAEEKAGLYRDPAPIGNRLYWESLLRKKSLGYEGHRLIRLKATADAVKNRPEVPVERHRTAIKRYDLSRPVKLLLKHGLLRKDRTFFDYGCGHGMDVEGLEALGYTASGWDPAFRPKSAQEPAKVVNLGYVLNVIEYPEERLEALRAASELAESVLIVSVLATGQETTAHQREFRDGFLTKSGTFQKFYEPGELEILIERVLDTEPVTLAPGICLVFKDDSAREAFVASRTRRVIDWSEIGSQLPFSQPTERKEARAGRYALHRELLDAFWMTLLDLGRLPESGEFDRTVDLRAAAGSSRKALDLVLENKDAALFEEARRIRKEDILVYLAMTRFRRGFRRKDLSLRAKRDIKAFFGDFDTANREAGHLLFASGDPGELELALGDVGFGQYDAAEGHLTFHRKDLNRLPAIFRIYVSCGAWIYGDLDGIDLIKIHLRSGKLTFLIYDDFEGKDRPILQERVKIQLRNQWLRIFDHRDEQQVLEDKGRYA